MLNTNTVVNAVERHRTLFFDASLNPVTPQPGQWFCEYDDDFDLGESNFCRDEALVEYVGPDESVCWSNEVNDFVPHGDPINRHLVSVDGGEDTRRPRGRILIRQS